VDSAQHTLKHVCVRNTKESVAEISLCISPLNPAPCASFLHPTEPTLRIPCVPSEPGLYKESVQPKHDGGREAVSWFEHAFPLLLKSADPALRPISVIQRAGEVLFVPSGWWHTVLNLEHTIAVTQNFCSPANFDAVWLRMRKSRPKLSQRFKKRLLEEYPRLHARALELELTPPPTGSPSSSTSSSSSSSSSLESGSSATGSGSRSGSPVAPKSGRRSPAAPGLSEPGSTRICDGTWAEGPAEVAEARGTKREHGRVEAGAARGGSNPGSRNCETSAKWAAR